MISVKDVQHDKKNFWEGHRQRMTASAASPEAKFERLKDHVKAVHATLRERRAVPVKAAPSTVEVTTTVEEAAPAEVEAAVPVVATRRPAPPPVGRRNSRKGR